MSVLLVASVGGHLSELAALAERSGVADDHRVWLTWRNPQSESVLAGADVVWVRPVQPRQLGAVLSVARGVPALLRRLDVTRVVTTGSALALSVVPVARAMGIPCHFIETATRPSGPSLTGKLLRRVPGTHLYTQNPGWADGNWAFRGSIFEGYRPLPPVAAPGAVPPSVRRVVVTLGTMADFGFRRLLERVVKVVPPDAEVLWQTGCTDTTGLDIDARPLIPAGELHEAIREADVVIGHCGCGTALAAFEAGKYPLLVPRESAHDEHVDDHQVFLAEELSRLDLALAVRVDDLDGSHLEAASGRSVERVEEPPPFELVEDGSHRERRRAGHTPSPASGCAVIGGGAQLAAGVGAAGGVSGDVGRGVGGGVGRPPLPAAALAADRER
jgi:UDP-N-acetylglucosamine--N-acetylmuramyl-(pentapeptide) pyrophosphoryl-undecaprenol N-acetylglucosamine transferase